MKFSQQQLKAINTDGGDMVVSASAGSGKTTVMIERVLRLIEGGAQLKNMLIATFTKAAAADMREKLLAALTERAADNANALAALGQLPQAQISTLHSFCQKLAKTYFYAIDLDPAFEIMGDGDCVLKERCLDEVLANASGTDFERLNEVMMTGRKDRKLRAAIKKTYDFAVSLPKPEQWLDDCLDGYGDESAAKKIITDSLDKERRGLLDCCRRLYADTCAADFRRNIAAAQSLIEALTHDDARLIISPPRTKNDPLFEDLNEDFKYLKEKTGKFLQQVQQFSLLTPSALALPFAAQLRDLTRELLLTYQAQKRKQGLADYNDLEHFAYDILQSPYAAQIRRSYSHVFVDEYQDINPLQDAIISALGSGRLFMVGDLKQSIYAFRGCDPSIFAAKRNDAASSKGVGVELNANYRTAPAIIERVNSVFSRCMSKDFGGVDYARDACLIAGLEDVQGARFRYVNIDTDGDAAKQKLEGVYRVSEHKDVQESDGAEAESDFVAGEILRLLSGGESGRVSAGDVAVLTRSKSKLSYLIRDKLKAMGVDAFVKEKSQYCALPETAPLIAVLRLCRNMRDDVALATALLSFYGGLSDGDLARISERALTGQNFHDAAELCPETAQFFAKLMRYSQLAQSLSVGELLTLIAVENDAFINVLKMEGGEERSKKLSEFLSLACSRKEESADDFLEYLDGEAGTQSGAPEGSLRIMSVHNSKGLEFDYVFLAGVHRQFNRTDFFAPIMSDKNLGLAFKFPDDDSRKLLPTYLSEAVRLKKQHEFLEEEMRIMYVALTRAKKGLTVSGCDIKPRTGYKCFQPPARPADFLDGLQFETIKAESAAITEQPPEYVPVFTGGDRQRAASIEKRIAYEYAFGGRAAKTSVTAAAHTVWESESYDYGQAAADGEEDAAARGTAYHLAMQKLDFEQPFEKWQENFCAGFCEEAKLVDFSAVSRAAADIKKITQGYTLHREKEFIVDDSGTLMQGVIDLLAVKEGTAIIVDYKTGSSPNKAAYVRQLELYAAAVEKVLNLKVEAKYIYALDASKLIRV